MLTDFFQKQKIYIGQLPIVQSANNLSHCVSREKYTLTVKGKANHFCKQNFTEEKHFIKNIQTDKEARNILPGENITKKHKFKHQKV